jgi:hypothetical protein
MRTMITRLGEPGAADRLRAFNEIQHRVTSQVGHLIRGGEHAYPDAALVEVLAEIARDGRVSGEFVRAFDRAIGLAARRAQSAGGRPSAG